MKWLLATQPVCFMAMFPTMFIYGNNSNEVGIGDVLVPMGVMLAVGMGVYACCVILTRNLNLNSIVTDLW